MNRKYKFGTDNVLEFTLFGSTVEVKITGPKQRYLKNYSFDSYVEAVREFRIRVQAQKGRERLN